MAHEKTHKEIRLSSAYGIERAAELAALLRASLSGSANLSVDLSAVVDMDVSAIQLLYAARKSCLAKGGDALLSGSVTPELSERLVAGGLIATQVRDGPSLASALPSYLAIGADDDR